MVWEEDDRLLAMRVTMLLYREREGWWCEVRSFDCRYCTGRQRGCPLCLCWCVRLRLVQGGVPAGCLGRFMSRMVRCRLRCSVLERLFMLSSSSL